MSTVKRVFFYVVTLATLGMFAGGAGILLTLCLNLIVGEYTWQRYVRNEFSLGLALFIIGGVLWLLFWRAIQKQVSGNPDETGSGIRKLFLNTVLVVTALVGLVGTAGFLRWLIGGVPLEQFPSDGITMLLAGGGLWYYHKQVEKREGQPSEDAKMLRRWYIYILTTFSLFILASNLINLLHSAIFQLPVWGEAIATGTFWNTHVQGNISWTLVGSASWVYYWFYLARDDTESTLRQVYLYLVAILGGAITALVALVNFLFKIFMLAFGGAGTNGDKYFLFMGWIIPAVVAIIIWIYHQKVVQEETAHLQEKRLSARRVFLYLMSFLGLSTLIAGLVTLLGILLDVIINATNSSITVTAGWWHSQLSLCLALLLVAIPIWLYYWKKILDMVTEGDVTERGARSRRIYLYTILGAAILALAGDLVGIFYQLINSLLQGFTGTNFLNDIKWSLQSLLIPLPVLLYHWRILRQDQRLGAEAVLPKKRVTILVNKQMTELVSKIEERLGARTRLLYHLEETPEDSLSISDEQLDELISEIRAAPGEKVMLVLKGRNIMVLPYKDK